MEPTSASIGYRARLAAEGRKWGNHLKVEASGTWDAWLDHPLIVEHYRQRALIGGQPWEQWALKKLGRPAERSLDLGCGSASRSIAYFTDGVTRHVEGFDASEARIAEAERVRARLAIPGAFRVGDVNTIELPPERYDLIFSVHSFHHFLELEHVMRQVAQALVPGGLFVLEEFTGPTQFQSTDEQIAIVQSLLGLLPERLRRLRWGAIKTLEGRPTPAEVATASPFESIRSAEICPLFAQHFNVLSANKLGGTIQHLLYNGIVHNFDPSDPEVGRLLQAIWGVEDTLIDNDVLPSDFTLLIGQRRDAPAPRA